MWCENHFTALRLRAVEVTAEDSSRLKEGVRVRYFLATKLSFRLPRIKLIAVPIIAMAANAFVEDWVIYFEPRMNVL
jgi:hypothetical protein